MTGKKLFGIIISIVMAFSMMIPSALCGVLKSTYDSLFTTPEEEPTDRQVMGVNIPFDEEQFYSLVRAYWDDQNTEKHSGLHYTTHGDREVIPEGAAYTSHISNFSGFEVRVRYYAPKNYDIFIREANYYINAVLMATGSITQEKNWDVYINNAISTGKPFCINGFVFTYKEGQSYEYTGYNYNCEQHMTDLYLEAERVENPDFQYDTVEGHYCISGLISNGDTLTLPTYANDKVVEGVSLADPLSIYDENIRTIVVGGEMSIIPTSFLNYSFPNLEKFVVSGSNPHLAQINGCLYNKKLKTLVACPSRKTELDIPEGITGIEHYACMYAKQLKTISIPASCVTLGASAFRECITLEEVHFAPQSCRTIKEDAFNGCISLKKIDMTPTQCAEIGVSAFSGCTALETVDLTTIPCYTISAQTFDGCTKLTDVQLPVLLKTVNENAFRSCPIRSITLPASLETIEEGAFASASGSVHLPLGLKKLSAQAFSPACILSLPQEIEAYYEIEHVIFAQDGSLVFYPYEAKQDQTYQIPEGTTAIKCSLGNKLSELSIPASVQNISVTLPKTTKLLVLSGSYAESYAIEHELSFESTLPENGDDDLSWLYGE